jgi:hypothetical protein
MTTDIAIPNPADDSDRNSGGPEGKPHSSGRSRRRGRVLSENDCRRMLSEIPTLVILKVISPAQANAMTRTLQVLLNETRGSQSGGPVQVDENLIAILRSRPDLLNLFEPFLSDDQIDRLVRGDSDEPV